MSFMRERSTNTLVTETMRRRHLKRVLEIEEQVYPRPWTHRTFVTELSQMRSGNRYYLGLRRRRARGVRRSHVQRR